MKNKRRSDASSSGAGAPAPAAITMKKIDRKTVEKNRRLQMKRLCTNLVSIIPSPYFNSSEEMASSTQQDQLQQATNYILQLRERLQQLKEKKAKLSMLDVNKSDFIRENDETLDSCYPIMELKDLGNSCFQVTLISRLHKNFMLFEVISVLEDEGADVVAVHVVTNDNKVYHTFLAQAKCPRVGVETSRIGGRLHDLISKS
ncbi:hypothetical protein V2J09_011995 [Rumex salicifolius]